MTELKPCPFCGHEVKGPVLEDWDSADDYWVIRCGYCGGMMYDQVRWVVVDSWNTRVGDHASK